MTTAALRRAGRPGLAAALTAGAILAFCTVGAPAHAAFTASGTVTMSATTGSVALDVVACRFGDPDSVHGAGAGGLEGRGRTCEPDSGNPEPGGNGGHRATGENQPGWAVSVGPADSPLAGFTDANAITVTTQHSAANIAVTVSNTGNLNLQHLVLATPANAADSCGADRRVDISVAGRHLLAGETFAELSQAPLDLLHGGATLAPGQSLSLAISLSGGAQDCGPGGVSFTLAGADA